MTVDVVVPDLGEGVDRGTVIEWLCDVGDVVEVGQALLTLELDKIDTDVPSPAAGTVADVRVDAGVDVTVGQVVATVQQ